MLLPALTIRSIHSHTSPKLLRRFASWSSFLGIQNGSIPADWRAADTDVGIGVAETWRTYSMFRWRRDWILWVLRGPLLVLVVILEGGKTHFPSQILKTIWSAPMLVRPSLRVRRNLLEFSASCCSLTTCLIICLVANQTPLL